METIQIIQFLFYLLFKTRPMVELYVIKERKIFTVIRKRKKNKEKNILRREGLILASVRTHTHTHYYF